MPPKNLPLYGRQCLFLGAGKQTVGLHPPDDGRPVVIFSFSFFFCLFSFLFFLSFFASLLLLFYFSFSFFLSLFCFSFASFLLLFFLFFPSLFSCPSEKAQRLPVLVAGQAAKDFSWVVVDPVLDFLYFFLCVFSQIGAFGDETAYDAVCVFVTAALI